MDGDITKKFKTKDVDDFVRRLVKKTMIEKDVEAAIEFLFKSLAIRHYGKADKLFCPYLIEAKYAASLDRKSRNAAKALAQAIHYLWEMFEKTTNEVDFVINWIILIDSKNAMIFPINLLESFWKSKKYDFTRPASDPCPLLVQDLLDWDEFKNAEVFTLRKPGVELFIQKLEETCQDFAGHYYMKITRRNFKSIFAKWRETLKIDKGIQLDVCLYMQELSRQSKLVEDEGRIYFFDDNKIQVHVDVNVSDYKNFWSHYERPVQPHEHEIILSFKDQLVHMNERWRTGEFFTPFEIVDKSYEKLLDYYGMDPLDLKEYTFWDPCCGQGNLLHGFPGPYNSKQHFLSTLNQEDIDIMNQQGLYPGALKFQYDWLNQTDEELPEEVKEALADKNRKWLFVMNPPWGSNCAGGAIAKVSGADKKKDTNTPVRDEMLISNLTQYPRELMYQCVFRTISVVSRYQLNAKICLICNWNMLFKLNNDFKKFMITKNIKLRSGFLFNGDKHFKTTSIPFACSLIYDNNAIDQNSIIHLGLITDKEIGYMKYEFNADEYLFNTIQKQSIGKESHYFLNRTGLSIIEKVKRNNKSIAYYCGDMTHTPKLQSSITDTVNHYGWDLTNENVDFTCEYTMYTKFRTNRWYNKIGRNFHDSRFTDTINVLAYLSFHPTYGRTTSFSQEFEGEQVSIRNPFFWISKEEFQNYPCLTKPLLSDLQSSENSWFHSYLQEHQNELNVHAKEIIRLATEITKKTMCLRDRSKVIHPRKGKNEEIVSSHLDLRWDAGWYQIVRGIIENPNVTLTDDVKTLYKQFQSHMKDLENYLRGVAESLKLTDEVILLDDKSGE